MAAKGGDVESAEEVKRLVGKELFPGE